MFAVGKYPVTYKPQSESGSSKDLYIRMVLGFSEAPNIDIYINPHNSVVSSDKFEALQLKLDDYALKDFSNVAEHQKLPGLQGGNSTERYHLSKHEQSTVSSLDVLIAADNKDKTVILNEKGDGFTVTPSKEIFQNIFVVTGNTVEVSENIQFIRRLSVLILLWTLMLLKQISTRKSLLLSFLLRCRPNLMSPLFKRQRYIG